MQSLRKVKVIIPLPAEALRRAYIVAEAKKITLASIIERALITYLNQSKTRELVELYDNEYKPNNESIGKAYKPRGN